MAICAFLANEVDYWRRAVNESGENHIRQVGRSEKVLLEFPQENDRLVANFCFNGVRGKVVIGYVEEVFLSRF